MDLSSKFSSPRSTLFVIPGEWKLAFFFEHSLRKTETVKKAFYLALRSTHLVDPSFRLNSLLSLFFFFYWNRFSWGSDRFIPGGNETMIDLLVVNFSNNNILQVKLSPIFHSPFYLSSIFISLTSMESGVFDKQNDFKWKKMQSQPTPFHFLLVNITVSIFKTDSRQSESQFPLETNATSDQILRTPSSSTRPSPSRSFSLLLLCFALFYFFIPSGPGIYANE